MKTSHLRLLDTVISIFLGSAAFAVYYLTLSAGAYPGKPAIMILQHTGIIPRLTPDYPLWTTVLWIATKVQICDVVTRLNLVSALSGSLSVALLYRIMTDAVSGIIVTGKDNAARAATAARLAGLGAALFLAFSTPFWIASNRAIPLSFHILILLCFVAMLLRYVRSGSGVLLCILGFLYGIGIVEFASLVLFAPIFAFVTIASMWYREDVNKAHITVASLSTLIGLSLYFLVAWLFWRSEGFLIREYTGYFEVLWFMWRDQVWSLTRSLPKIGWMILIFMTVTPFLTSLAVGRRALNEEKDWTYYLLHVVLTGLAVCVLLNVRFAPWSMTGIARIQTTPYLLNACVFGYLLAYWYLLPAALWQGSDRRVHAFLRKCMGPVIAIAGFIVLCLAPFRNVHEADGRQCRFINVIANEIVTNLKGRSWLVTDGFMDDHIRIAAREAGADVGIINPRQPASGIGNKIALQKLDSPRLRNLAEISILTLLQEWLASEDDATETVAVMSIPDLWIGAGFKVVPNNLNFLGSADAMEDTPAELMSDHSAFWDRILPLLQGTEPGDRMLAGSRAHLIRHAGLVANNLGVLLEDLESPSLAFEAYSKAIEIDEDNLSALLNQAAMVASGFQTDEAARIEQRVKVLKNRRGSGIRKLWALSRYYGYVRTPETFAQIGLAWALSGRPGVAVSGLRTALQLSGRDQSQTVKLSLADVYLKQQEEEKGEAIFAQVLEEDPGNAKALLGMTRALRKKGDLAGAELFLQKAEQAGAHRIQASLEWASLNVAAGKIAEARIVLEELTSLHPKLTIAQMMLADTLLHQNDRDELSDFIANLHSLPQGDGIASYVRAQMAWKEQDLATTRRELEQALQVWPSHQLLISQLLRLDLLEGEEDSQRRHALRLLKLDPQNPLGNYTIGSLHIVSREYELAEDSLRRSLDARRSPEALNDLAWLVFRKRGYEEAEKLARESLELNKKIYATWDTLGLVLMRIGRLEEAEEAFKQSLSLFQGDLRVLLNMAELKSLQGDKKQAREMLERVQSQSHQLPPEDQARLKDIREKLGG
jgi:tetratricopeptide (TPR) repeat protein